jgi:hypothetical protein
VSEPVQPVAPEDLGAGDGEEVDALPVLAAASHAMGERAASGALTGDWRGAGAVIPAMQAAAVAAGGFVAGAAVVGLVHRRHQRSAMLSKGRRGARRSGKAGDLVQIVGSRSFLLDVHLLGGPGGNR